jgi:lycopene cyclase domain-containing protein
MTLSYLQVHLLFVLPPIAVLWFARRRLPADRTRIAGVGIALMTAVAVAYTTPWDNYLIEQGVWWYGEGRVLARIWAAPVEEYAFFVLQSVLTALWLYRLDFDPAYRPGDLASVPRVAGAVGLLAVAAVAAGVLLVGPTSGFYMAAILAWACPVLALQWAVGGGYLVRTWRRWGVAVAVPTLYLWFVDRLAIGFGVWTISSTHTVGVSIVGLPIEEATFFLVTNVMLVFGLTLFEWVLDWWSRADTRSRLSLGG